MTGMSLDVNAMRQTSARTATRTSANVPLAGALGVNIVPPQQWLLEPDRHSHAQRHAPQLLTVYPAFAPTYTRAQREAIASNFKTTLVQTSKPHQRLCEAAVAEPLAPDSEVTAEGLAAYAAITAHENDLARTPGPRATREELVAYWRALLADTAKASHHAERAEHVVRLPDAALSEIELVLAESNKLQAIIDRAEALEDAGAKFKPTVPELLEHERQKRQRHAEHVASHAERLGNFGRRGFHGSASLALRRRVDGFTRRRVADAHKDVIDEAGRQMEQAWDVLGLCEPGKGGQPPSDVDPVGHVNSSGYSAARAIAHMQAVPVEAVEAAIEERGARGRQSAVAFSVDACLLYKARVEAAEVQALLAETRVAKANVRVADLEARAVRFRQPQVELEELFSAKEALRTALKTATEYRAAASALAAEYADELMWLREHELAKVGQSSAANQLAGHRSPPAGATRPASTESRRDGRSPSDVARGTNAQTLLAKAWEPPLPVEPDERTIRTYGARDGARDTVTGTARRRRTSALHGRRPLKSCWKLDLAERLPN